MRSRGTVELTFALLLVFSLHAALDAQTRKKRPAKQAAPACGDLLGFQVLLDRQGFSPGQIDGQPGPNFSHALAALQSAKGLKQSGADCATWQALSASGSDPVIRTYTVTADDMKGPFERIPPKLSDQASLPSLAYQTVEEKLAERFHASPALFRRLNRGPIREGQEIKVPGVTPFNPDTKPTPDPAAANATIVVSRDDSSLSVKAADGTILFHRAGDDRERTRSAAAGRLQGARP